MRAPAPASAAAPAPAPDERAFERLLLAYPARWRARHGAAMLGTLLDAAEHEGRMRPSVSQRFDVIGHGLGQTVLGWLPARLRDALGEAALATGFAFALCFFWFHSRAPHTLRSWTPDVLYAFGPFAHPGVVVSVFWALAFVLALTPWRSAQRAALGVATAVALLLPAVSLLVPEWDRPSTLSIVFFTMLGVLALAGGRPSRRAIVLGAAVVLGVLTWFELQLQPVQVIADRWFWHGEFALGWLGWMPWFALALATVLAVARYRGGALTVLAFASVWLPMWFGVAIARQDGLGLLAAATGLVIAVALLVLRYCGAQVTRLPAATGTGS